MSETREEHLKFCKTRALEILDAKGPADVKRCIDAVGSMMSDLTKWQGGLMYEFTPLPIFYGMVLQDMIDGKVDKVRAWIEGFR